MSQKWAAAKTAASRSRALLHQIDRVRSSPGVRRVHQTRVACRRLGQSLAVLRPHLPKKLRRNANRAVKAIRKYFGPSRDADVLLQHLHVWLATHPADHKGATAAAELVARLADERRAHTRQLLTDLRSKEANDHVRSIYALFTWCAEGRRKKKHQDRAVPTVQEDADVRLNRQRVAEMLADQDLDTTPAGLHHAHEVRIVVKTCRYGVEALTDDKADLLPFKQQQDALGEVQDMTVLLGLIDDAIAKTPKRPEPGLEHLSQRTGLEALRANILGSIGENFATFHKAYLAGTRVLDRLL